MSDEKTITELQHELEQAYLRIAALESQARKQENEELFSILFNVSSSQMALTDVSNGQYVEVNDAFLQSMGFEREEVIGKTATELNLFVDREQRMKLLQKMAAQGFLRGERVLIRPKVGDFRYGIFAAEYLQLKGTKRLLTVMNDITETVQAEERWQFALDGADHGVWDLNFQTGRVFYSNRWKSMLGYSEDEIGDGMEDWTRLIHPDDLSGSQERMDLYRAGKLPVYRSEFRLRCKDGSYKWIESNGKMIRRTEEGEPLRMIGTHQDISQRKQSESDLRENEARLRGFLNATPDAMLIIDTSGKIVEANAQTEMTFGFHKEELIGRQVEDLLPDRLRSAHVLNRARFIQKPTPLTTGVNRSIYGKRKNGEEFTAEVSLSDHKMAGGEEVVLCAVRDVTERMRYETVISAQRDLARLAGADITQEALLNACLQTALTVSGLDGGCIYFLNPDRNSFQLIHAQGFSPEFVDSVREFSENTPSSDTILAGNIKYFCEPDLHFQESFIVEGLRCAAVIPMQHEGTVFGCMTAASHQLDRVPDHARTAIEVIISEISNLFIYQRTRQSLQDSRKQLSQALVAARMGTWRLHIPTNRMTWSAEAAAIFGVEATEDDFNSILTCFYPDDRAAVTQGIREALEQKKMLSLENRIFDAAGNILWIGHYGHIEYGLDGSPVAFVGLLQDITARKQMENELEAETFRRRILFDVSPDGILVIDPPTASFLEFNTAAHEQLGYTREEFAGLHIYDVEALETDADTRARISGVLQSGKADFETLHRTKQGEIRNIHVTAQIVEIQGQEVYYCTWRDITERKRAEAAQRESEQIYRDLINSTNDTVCVLDFDTNILDVNNTMTEVLGYTREELLGMKIPQIDVNLSANQIQNLASNMPKDMRQVFYTAHRTKDGRIFPVEISSSLVEYKGRTVILSIARDISERKRTEDALRQSQANLEMAQSIAHMGSWDTFLNEGKARWSKELLTLFDLDPESEAPDFREFIQMIHPEDRDLLMRERQKALGTRSQVTFECRSNPERGKLRTFQTSIRASVLEDGVTVHLSGTMLDVSDLKLAFEQLRESEAKYRLLAENSTDVIWVLGVADERFRYVSPSVMQLLGYGVEEMLAGNAFETLSPDSFTNIDQAMTERMKLFLQGEVRTYTDEVEQYHKDGTLVWVEITTRFVLNSDTGVLEVYGVSRNITERKRAQDKLAAAEQRYRSLIENAPDGIVLVSADDRFTYASPSVKRIFGYEPAEVESQKPDELTHPEDLPMVLGELVALMQDPTRVPMLQYRFKHKNGEYRWIESTFSNLLGVPGVDAIVINFRDIQERREAEEKARRSHEQLLKFATQVPGMLYQFEKRLDGHFCVPFSTEAIRDIYGCAPEDVREDFGPIARVIHPQDLPRVVAEIEESSRTLKAFQTEYRIQQPGQSVRWLLAQSQPELLEDGRIIWSGFNTDITQQKLAQEALRKSQAQLSEAQRIGRLGYLEWNGIDPVLDCSEEIYEILDLPRGTAITKQVLAAMLKPGDYDRLQKQDLQFIQRREDINYEYSILTRTGAERWLHHIAKITYNEVGVPNRMMVIIQDVTDRKLAEDALQSEQTRMSKVADTLPGAINTFQLRPDGSLCIPYASRAFEDVFGLNLAEVADNIEAILARIPAGQIPGLLENVQESARTLQPWHNEYEYRHPLKGSIWVEGISMPVKEADGGVVWHGFSTDVTARKQAEARLRENEERFRTVADFTYDLEYWIDEHRQLLYISPACERLTGYTRDEFLKDPELLRTILHPDDRDIYNCHLETEFAASEPDSIDFRILTKDGQERWINHTCQGVTGGDGQPRGRRVSNRDITASKRAAENLRASEEKYRLLSEELEARVQQRTAEVQDLYDHAPTGYHSLDEQGRLAAINQTELTWLGYQRAEVLGRPFDELLTEESAMRFAEAFGLHKQSGKTIDDEFDLRRMDGSVFPVLMNLVAVTDERGHYLSSRSVIYDITERKKAENDLRESEETYRALFENTNDAIFLIDPQERRYVRVNSRAPVLLGYERNEEIVGRKVLEFIPPDQQQDAMERMGRVLGGEVSPPFERTFIRKDGTRLVTEIMVSLIRDANGKPKLLQSMERDITQRKQAEDSLYRANLELERAMRMKDEFLASMSHELRTPLTGILGLAEALQFHTYGPLSERQTKAIHTIEDSGHHLLDLINDVLDLSKIEAGMLELSIEPVQLAEVCQAALQLTKGMAQKKRHGVSFSMSPPVVMVRGDNRRLKQMLVNLLSNAIKFTPEGGTLGLEVVASEDDQMVRMSVWDRGIGIAQDDVERLFQPFVQLESSLARQYEGTGLGLSLVQRMAELHGGRVMVQSVPGAGSRFTIQLPWSPQDPQTSQQPADARSLRTAMLVEDSEIDAGQISRNLRILGIEPLVHAMGQGVVESAAENRPGVILLDLNLPDMPGFDLLAALKTDERTKDIPVVISSVAENRSRAETLGAAGYLVKPIAFAGLRDELNKVSAQQRQVHSAAESTVSAPLVLIVDDNDVLIETLSSFLEMQGFRTQTAMNGMELMRTAPGLLPDLILLDIQMPGMDGFEATRQVRAHPDPALARVPIIALTALAMTGDRERCLAAGANEYISKPVKLLDLVETIRKLLK